jgi:hypothetical protein
MELTKDTFRVKVQEILANDHGPAAVVRSSATRGDKVLDSRQIHHSHMTDERVVEWQFRRRRARRRGVLVLTNVAEWVVGPGFPAELLIHSARSVPGGRVPTTP